MFFGLDTDLMYFLHLLSDPNIRLKYNDSVKFRKLLNDLIHLLEINYSENVFYGGDKDV